jgi:GT2 family glycosyltransferase
MQPIQESGAGPVPRVTVVIATRDRAPELRRTLEVLTALPERPAIVVVDNASRDATADMVRSRFPAAGLVTLRRNRKAAARNVGVRRAATEYVAFSDDDSWWEPGALDRACAVLDRHPGVGLVTGRTLVGHAAADDPLNAVLAASPLPRAGLPGSRVLGFLGCAVVVRRSAFLRAGGYRALLGIGGEEELLALDLAAAGWPAVYVDTVVARHFPSAVRDAPARRAAELRNRVLVAWLRRPVGHALVSTGALAGRAAADATARRALAGLLTRLPRALATRRRLPPGVTAQLRILEGAR